MFQIINKHLYLKVKGRITYYYSYETVIVVVITNNELSLPVIHVNMQYYNKTTSRHRNLILEEYLDNPKVEYETQEEFNSLLEAIKF